MTRGGKIAIALVGVAVIGAIVVANVVKAKGRATEVQAEAAKAEQIVSRVRAPGTIQSETTVNLSATQFGQVTSVAVVEGQAVQKGQFLLRLDDTQYRAAVSGARAAAASAEARLRLAEASSARAVATLERSRALAKEQLVSAQELEAAETDARVLRAERDAAAEAVAQAREQLRQAQDQLAKTTFTAPVSGVVSALNVEEGEMAVTGTMNNPGTVLLTISDMSKMEIWAEVDEADIVDVRAGQEVSISVDAIPDTTFRGRVRDVASSGSGSTSLGTDQKTHFLVKVSFSDDVPQIKPGMSGDVEIVTATRSAKVAVPIQSVVIRKAEDLEKRTPGRRGRRGKNAAQADTTRTDHGDKKKDRMGVFVVGTDNVVTFHDARTGVAGDTSMELYSDVKVGDKVVTGPYKTLRSLKAGTKVKITAAEKDAKKS